MGKISGVSEKSPYELLEESLTAAIGLVEKNSREKGRQVLEEQKKKLAERRNLARFLLANPAYGSLNSVGAAYEEDESYAR